MRLIDADVAMQNVLDEIRYKESLYTSTVRLITQKAIDAAPTINPKTLQPTTHWTNIKKRPPDDGEEVICYCGNKDYPGCYGEIYILTYAIDNQIFNYLKDAITHWMPKPKPPEDTE